MNIKKRELTKTINCCGTGKQCREDFKWCYSFVLLVFFHSILVENMTHLRFKSYVQFMPDEPPFLNMYLSDDLP